MLYNFGGPMRSQHLTSALPLVLAAMLQDLSSPSKFVFSRRNEATFSQIKF